MPEGARLEALLRWLPEAPARARTALDELGGAEQVEAEARRCGLLPLLEHHLPDRFRVSEPERAAARFQFARLERASATVVQLLADAEVESILLKGVALASRLYPEPWLRPTSDVDVLVRPGDFARARRAFLEAGWTVRAEAPESVFELSHHATFTGPQRGYAELHFSPTCGFQNAVDVESLFARRTPVTIGAVGASVLSPVDEIIHLSAHAGHHSYGGVKWLYDLKLLAPRLEGRWPEVVEEARRVRLAAATGMALREARRRVGAEVPDWVTRKLGPGAVRGRLARFIVQRLPRGVVGFYPLSLLLADRFTARWGGELAARPVYRAARLLGAEEHVKALIRAVGRDSARE